MILRNRLHQTDTEHTPWTPVETFLKSPETPQKSSEALLEPYKFPWITTELIEILKLLCVSLADYLESKTTKFNFPHRMHNNFMDSAIVDYHGLENKNYDFITILME